MLLRQKVSSLLKKVKQKFFSFNLYHRLFCAINHKTASLKDCSNEILIIRLDLIGDCSMFSGSMIQIKKLYSNCKINVICLKNTKCIFERIGCINKILTYDSNPNSINYKEIKKLQQELGKKKLKVLLQPQTSRMKAADVLASLIPAEEKIAIEDRTDNSSKEWKKKSQSYYSRIIPIPKGWRNEYEYYLAFLKGLGIQVELKDIQPRLYFSVENKFKSRYFAIVPGASLLQRAWNAEKFANVIVSIFKSTGWLPVILGAKSESFIGEKIISACPVSTSLNCINLIGKTSLTEMIDILSNSEMVLCNDSAAAHISSAVGNRCIAITGGGHIDRFLPYPIGFNNSPMVVSETLGCEYCEWSPKHIIINNKVCFKRVFEEGKNYLCISKIKEDKVIQIVKSNILN